MGGMSKKKTGIGRRWEWYRFKHDRLVGGSRKSQWHASEGCSNARLSTFDWPSGIVAVKMSIKPPQPTCAICLEVARGWNHGALRGD